MVQTCTDMESGIGESWETVKSRANSLKGELDTKMQELGRLNKRLASNTQSTPGDRLAALDAQIQLVVALREEVERGLHDLANASEALSQIAATSAQAAQAVRFRETHTDMVRDFKRVAESIDHQYQHARLLPGGRSSKSKGLDDVEEGLMREKNALGSSLSMADEVIGSATAAHDMLVGQRKTLAETKGKLGTLDTILPGINGLIGKITDRKNKERVVLSVTIASCCFFTIWYKFL